MTLPPVAVDTQTVSSLLALAGAEAQVQAGAGVTWVRPTGVAGSTAE